MEELSSGYHSGQLQVTIYEWRVTNEGVIGGETVW